MRRSVWPAATQQDGWSKEQIQEKKKHSLDLDHREFDSRHAATFSSYTDSHTALDDTLALGVQAWKGSYL